MSFFRIEKIGHFTYLKIKKIFRMKQWTSENYQKVSLRGLRLHIVMLCTIFYVFFTVQFDAAKIKSLRKLKFHIFTLLMRAHTHFTMFLGNIYE